MKESLKRDDEAGEKAAEREGYTAWGKSSLRQENKTARKKEPN